MGLALWDYGMASCMQIHVGVSTDSNHLYGFHHSSSQGWVLVPVTNMVVEEFGDSTDAMFIEV